MLHSRVQTMLSILLVFLLGFLFISLQVFQQRERCDKGLVVIQADENASLEDGFFGENYCPQAFTVDRMEISGCSDRGRVTSFPFKDEVCFSKLFIAYRTLLI